MGLVKIRRIDEYIVFFGLFGRSFRGFLMTFVIGVRRVFRVVIGCYRNFLCDKMVRIIIKIFMFVISMSEGVENLF